MVTQKIMVNKGDDMKKQNKITAMQDEVTTCEPELFLGYHEKQHTLSHITLSIDEEVKDPKYYRHVLARINDLDEADCVELVISSYGGSVDGAVSIINALRRTEAHTVAVLDGIAASAASLIALSCNEIVVSDNAKLMIHSAHGVIGGTMSNSAAYSAFMDAELRKLMTSVYLGFLTQSELEDVFKGCELWFNSDQIIERLQKRQEYLESLEEDCQGNCDGCNCKPTLPSDWNNE